MNFWRVFQVFSWETSLFSVCLHGRKSKGIGLLYITFSGTFIQLVTRTGTKTAFDHSMDGVIIGFFNIFKLFLRKFYIFSLKYLSAGNAN